MVGYPNLYYVSVLRKCLVVNQKFNHKVVINIIKETRYINVTDPFSPVPSVLDN